MKALALDLGASSGKVILGAFDGKKITTSEIYRFKNAPVKADGHLFWDIEAIYAHLLDGLSKAAPEGFSSFGVDSFSNDYGLLDRNGEVLGPVHMYRDRRTDGVLEWIDDLISPLELYKRTGNQRARFATLVQLAAQTKAADRGLLDYARHILFVPDLLVFFLGGNKAAEYTIASVSQLYNRAAADWDREIIRALHIPEGIFPEVITPASYAGDAKPLILHRTGAAPFRICAVAHHDTASAVAAVPSQAEHFAYISSGTWSLLGSETNGMITTEQAYASNFANEGGVGGRNRFLKNIMGLWLLQECQREFALRGVALTFEELDRKAEASLPFRSIIDPDDPLFFEPGEMIRKIQSRCRQWKQPVPETEGEIARCIHESLALAYRAAFEQLELLTGLTIPSVHIVGGGARSKLLNQFAAAALQRPVFAGPYEAAALGNLCSQFVSAGEISDWTEARALIRSSFEIREFLPEQSPAWDAAFERFMHIKAISRHID